MRVLTIEFLDISAQRFESENAPSKVDTSLDISDINSLQLDSPNKLPLLKVSFSFGLSFAQDFAKINLKGFLIVEMSESDFEKILDEWKNKNLSDNFKLPLLNIILRKCTLRALALEDELGIPPHFSLPSFKLKK